MCACVLSSVRLFETSWTIAHQAPLSKGFPKQECWSGVLFPCPGHLPIPGIEPVSPVFQADSLPLIHLLTAKSLQSCPTLCNPIDGSPPGSPIPGILQARTLEWVAISFSNAGKWKVKVKLLSRVRLWKPKLAKFAIESLVMILPPIVYKFRYKANI